MPTDTEITELDELGAEKVSGVGNPANGTPWLLLKASGVEASPESPHTESAEADAIEEEMTKAIGAGFCFDPECGLCKDRFGPMHEFLLKRKLSAEDRKKIPKGDFAIPEKAPGSGSYPIADESHARNALARASGKPVEARVRAAVRRKYPNIKVEKMSPGVPDYATEMPRERGHLDTGRSGLAGPVTAGVTSPQDPSRFPGGQSTYVIPDEAKVTDNPPFRALKDRNFSIEVVDKQNWVSLDNPGPQPEGETAAVNNVVLRCMADVYAMLKGCMAAQKADPDGMTDPLDAQVWAHLEDVCATLKNALIDQAFDVAGLDAQALKAGLSAYNPAAGDGAKTSKEETMSTTVTKEELSAFIAESSTKAVKEALKAERAAARKAMKKKGKKMPGEMAEKNANNGGDISEGTMRGEVHGNHPAEDVDAVGGPVNSEYVNKAGKAKKGAKQEKVLKEVLAQVGTLSETVSKMARRPRTGGPVLDGTPHGAGSFPASEGRQTETVAKGAGDPEIERLEKEIEAVKDKPGMDNAQRLSDLNLKLTQRRLYNAHTNGLL